MVRVFNPVDSFEGGKIEHTEIVFMRFGGLLTINAPQTQDCWGTGFSYPPRAVSAAGVSDAAWLDTFFFSSSSFFFVLQRSQKMGKL